MTSGPAGLEPGLRRAYAERDLSALEGLLAADVRWGDDEHPRRCRSRSDVLATFARMLSAGVDADLTEVVAGTQGILCGLRVRWPQGGGPDGGPEGGPGSGRMRFQVHLVRAGRIAEICAFDDRDSAAAAAGVPH